MIRGLALRSLCGLRVKNLVEYVTSPIQKGLQDSSAYVRTNAVMGVLKLYHIAPSICKDNDFISVLKRFLMQDRDSQVLFNSFYLHFSYLNFRFLLKVVLNCLCSLQEIISKEIVKNTSSATKDLEFLLSRPVVYNLLNRSMSTDPLLLS